MKVPNTKFHENPSSGIPADMCGRTYDQANGHFSLFMRKVPEKDIYLNHLTPNGHYMGLPHS